MSAPNFQVFGDGKFTNVVIGGTAVDVRSAKAMYAAFYDASISISGGGAACSGSFISKDGWALTAAHCVATTDPTTKYADTHVAVTNYNGTGKTHVIAVPAANIFMDGSGDIAIMKVPGITNQKFLKWGNSRLLKKGDCVFILGNPRGEDHLSISAGVVRDNTYVDTSGTQPVESIWADSPGFGGNSGSPMLDLSGNIVGVYTFGTTGTESLGGGMTQAIAEPVVNRMKRAMSDYYLLRGEMGMYTMPLLLSSAVTLNLTGPAFDLSGNEIQTVDPGSAADVAGLMVGDIIVKSNLTSVGHYEAQTHHTTAYWGAGSVGTVVSIKYIRPPFVAGVDPTVLTTTATLGAVTVTDDAPLNGRS